jgi:hypothetical protein
MQTAEFVKEQESAQGNFPEPCPVIYNGPSEELGTSTTTSVSAVVLLPGDGIICIAFVDAMQPNTAEIERAKELKKRNVGIDSILVQSACVGDLEDLE